MYDLETIKEMNKSGDKTIPYSQSEYYNLRFFIGSNNENGRLEIGKLEKILNKYFEGYTLNRVSGYWKNKKEKSAVVEIFTKKLENNFEIIPVELEKILHQEKVIFTIQKVIGNF